MEWNENTTSEEAQKYHEGFKSTIGQYIDVSEQQPVTESVRFDKSVFILDSGCGSGRYLKKTSSEQSFVGLDISLEMLKVAKNELKNGFFVAGELEYLPFKDNVFDEIICVRVLQHIRDQQKAINELSRICKKGGFLTVLSLNSWTLHCLYKNFRMSSFMNFIDKNAGKLLSKKTANALGLTKWDFEYDNYCSLPELENMLKKARFQITEKKGGTIGSQWMLNYFYTGAALERYFPKLLKSYFNTCLFLEKKLSSAVPFNYFMDKVIVRGQKK